MTWKHIVLIQLISTGGRCDLLTYDGNSSSLELKTKELIFAAVKYYQILGAGPSDEEVSHLIWESTKRFDDSVGLVILERCFSAVLPGLHKVNELDSQRIDLETHLYAPFHHLMLALRLAALPRNRCRTPRCKQSPKLLLGDTIAMIPQYMKSVSQVGFYRYFIGLEGFLASLYPNQASEARSLAVEFVEKNFLSTSLEAHLKDRYRTYLEKDKTVYPASLFKIEAFIAQGVPKSSDDARQRAIAIVRDFVNIALESWTQGDDAFTNKYRRELPVRIQEIVDRIGENVIHDN